MKKWAFCIGLIAVLILGVVGYYGMAAAKARGKAQQEIAAQQSEKQQCGQRLTLLYKAWQRYQADHKGAEPPSVESLVPKYVSDPALLVCPTAQRWISQRKSITQGNIKIGDKTYAATYGFQWLTAGAARSRKALGDKAPLITCDAHEEGLYLAVFNKATPLGAFDPEARSHYMTELQEAKVLAVLRNGTVQELAPDKP